ncbi:MAG: hypothetical protein A4S09_11625 [Proteobacteria bacterium SG_bin7]|nr:MAG: hypothetical protein A4S09_11625 [Proteobacteria bacterium SG_bin7]
MNSIPPELANPEPYNPPPPPGPLSKRPNINGLIYSLFIAFFCTIISQVFWSGHRISSYLTATPKQVFEEFEFWRVFTTMFTHSDAKHLFSNLYMLGILGALVGGYFGFIIFPFVSIILGALVNVVSLLTYAPNVVLLGASGLVYLLAGFWFTMFVLVDSPRPLPVRLMRAIGVSLIILFPTTFEPEISYRTHAIGFMVGWVFALPYSVIYKNLMLDHSEKANRPVP